MKCIYYVVFLKKFNYLKYTSRNNPVKKEKENEMFALRAMITHEYTTSIESVVNQNVR